MKNIFILLIIVFYQHHNVSSHYLSPMDYIAQKIGEFASTLAESMRMIKDKMNLIFFSPSRVRIKYKTTPVPVNPKKMHKVKVFSNYIQSMLKNYSIKSGNITIKPVEENSSISTPQISTLHETNVETHTVTTTMKTVEENASITPQIWTLHGRKVETHNTTMKPVEENATMFTPHMAALHGRKIETHNVTTSDGYILTVHRLLANNDTMITNKTVLLHHGLLGSSADWLLLGPTKSLPYILSDAGYDVWMTNARGNYYSRKHLSRRANSAEFWNFTFQDMGQYDLPTTIDYIRSVKTVGESINYVGHSMGASTLLVLLSSLPVYNTYLRMGVFLAPLAFMTEVRGPLEVLSKMLKTPSEQLLDVLGHHAELFPSRSVPDWLSKKYCVGPKLYCRNPLFFISGGVPQLESRNSSFISSLLYHIPAGGSVKTIIHYAQMIKSGKFHKFNDVPAEFTLRDVTLPIAMFSSSEDWLATIPNVAKLYDNIANPIDHYILRNKNFSHSDFVWGAEAHVMVFPKIVEFLQDGLKIKATKMNEIL